MNNKKIVLRMCVIAVMSALSIILELFVKINLLGYAKITIYALPLLVCGIAFGPIEGLVAGFVTGFVTQCFSEWGLSITTPLWMLAPMAWGLISGLLYKIKKLHNFSLLSLAIIISVTSLSVTLINTFATWLDGVILGYDSTIIFVQVIVRISISLVMAVFYTFLIQYILRALKPLLN